MYIMPVSPMSFGQKENNSPIELSDIAYGNGGFVINGEAEADYSGRSVSGAGDERHGLADLIIGAYKVIPTIYAGKSVVFGQKENNSPIELSDIADGNGGFVINGKNEYDYSGYSVSSAGDVNGDDLADLIIAPTAQIPMENRQAAPMSSFDIGDNCYYYLD